MINELKNIETLISKLQKEFVIYENFIKKHKHIEIQSFESTYEHIFDIYSLRWQHLQEQGKTIIGLEDLITNLKKTQDIGYIKTTILNKTTETIVIFTDIDCKIFLGIIYLGTSS